MSVGDETNSGAFAEYHDALERIDPFRLNGRVTQVIGLVVEANGPEAEVGELCHIRHSRHDAGVDPKRKYSISSCMTRTYCFQTFPVLAAIGCNRHFLFICRGGSFKECAREVEDTCYTN